VSEKRLRVGFDGRALASPAPGMRRYLRELTAALVGLGVPLELVALGGDGPMPPGIAVEPVPWHPPTNLGWTAVGLARAARRASLDVYHAPAYTAPPWGVHPLVVTLHDVSYARHPEWYPYRRGPLRRWFYRASARAADLVITDSAFSRGEIEAAYGVPRERIRVVPLGVSPAFTPGPPPDRLPAGVRQPYVLHVGDVHERRNLVVALAAVLALRARGGPAAELSLVLAGTDRGAGPALARRASEAGQPGALVMPGPVPEDELLALYRGAAALVYPSRYEGFGLPLVEAMACGLPVLASRAATAEEVGGDAVLLLSPDDPEAWAEAMAVVLGHAARAGELRRLGLARASLFTWRRAAEATWAVYQECAGERR
jgi:glycosyltransferase involved in cell wall biosynthesis